MQAKSGEGGELEVRCPQCRLKIQERDGDYLVVRNAILRIDLRTHRSFAKCPRCKRWNQVAIRLVSSPAG